MFSIRKPFCQSRAAASVRNFRLDIPLYRGSVSGKQLADVAETGSAQQASTIAWQSTSPSECPIRPLSCGISTPPRIKMRAGPEPMQIETDTDSKLHRDACSSSRKNARQRQVDGPRDLDIALGAANDRQPDVRCVRRGSTHPFRSIHRAWRARKLRARISTRKTWGVCASTRCSRVSVESITSLRICFTVSTMGTARTAAPLLSASRMTALDFLNPHERPHRIVNGDDRRIRAQVLHGDRNRILPARSALDDRNGLSRIPRRQPAFELRRRIRGAPRRGCDRSSRQASNLRIV